MVPYAKTIKILNSGRLLIAFNSTLAGERSNSTRSIFFICVCFCLISSIFPCFRQRMAGRHQISWQQRIFVYHQNYRDASSYAWGCIYFLDQEHVSYNSLKIERYDAISFTFQKCTFRSRSTAVIDARCQLGHECPVPKNNFVLF
jgi:hypothetical protein